jgi:mRNA-degrading endonuclease RelE of RelBE toxin-antitoxin system
MTRDERWTWELSSTAQDDLDTLSPENQDRILDKLDEIVDSPWRDPPDYGEPLQNSPYKKIRIGEFRLSVSFRSDERRLVVARIKRRSGAYTADDD